MDVTSILFLLIQNRHQTHDWTLIGSGANGLGIQEKLTKERNCALAKSVISKFLNLCNLMVWTLTFRSYLQNYLTYRILDDCKNYSFNNIIKLISPLPLNKKIYLKLKLSSFYFKMTVYDKPPEYELSRINILPFSNIGSHCKNIIFIIYLIFFSLFSFDIQLYRYFLVYYSTFFITFQINIKLYNTKSAIY